MHLKRHHIIEKERTTLNDHSIVQMSITILRKMQQILEQMVFLLVIDFHSLNEDGLQIEMD